MSDLGSYLRYLTSLVLLWCLVPLRNFRGLKTQISGSLLFMLCYAVLVVFFFSCFFYYQDTEICYEI